MILKKSVSIRVIIKTKRTLIYSVPGLTTQNAQLEQQQ